MTRSVLPLLFLLGACHQGYLSPVDGPEGDADTDTDADTDGDTDLSCDVSLHERGDEQDSSEGLGAQAPEVVICGELYALSNDDSAYTGDFDWADFTAAAGGGWRFELSWDEPDSDLDLFVLDSTGAILAGVATAGIDQPELLELPVTEGADYGFAVVGWQGPATTYELALR